MKRSLALMLFMVVLFSSCTLFKAEDSVLVTDFGLEPNSRRNAVPAVQKALEACRTKKNSVLIFPKGRYDFWPHHSIEKNYYESNTDVSLPRRCAILIEKFNGLTVEANGSEFIYHDRMQPFTIDNSQNIAIRNVNIDWDIPLTAQAQVAAVTDEYIDLAINHLESPYIIENNKLVFVGEGWKSKWDGTMEFEKETRLIVPQTGDDGCLGRNEQKYQARELKPGLVRLQNRFQRKPAVGNYLVLRHSARDHAGTFIFESDSVSMENVNLYHCAGLGILCQYSGNLSFHNVNCVPNAAKNRILSGHDDGMHFSNCRGKLTIVRCRFQGLMDDPINVHGTSVKILEKTGERQLVCKFMHPQSGGFTWAREGDRIGFIDRENMSTNGAGVASSFKARNPEVFELNFQDPLPDFVSAGRALENLTWTPDVEIKDNFFASSRARGVLITTPGKVEIEGNIFESSGSAILISGDANGWYESGAVKDVLIRGNTFNDPCMTSPYQFVEGIISIYPVIPKLDPAKPFHRNIRIEENTFHPFDFPVLYAKSVEGLTFTNNKLIRSSRFQPWHKRKWMLTFEACRKVQVSGNTFKGEVLGKNIRLVNTPPSELALDEKQGLKIEN
jgi:hypothetical protein